MRNIFSVSNDDFSKWMIDLNESTLSKRIEFYDDPVALGVAAHRLWKTHAVSRWSDFHTITVEPQDRETADDLRAYYRASTQHILFDVLRGQVKEVSEFRKKLALIASNEYKTPTEQDRGLFYRLPYFYQEDCALDRVFATNMVADPYRYYAQFVNQSLDMQLVPLERVLCSRRRFELVQFWFHDRDREGVYQTSVASNNPLLSLFDSLFQQPTLPVTANIAPALLHGRRAVYGNVFNIKLRQR